jgi:sodium/potassium-transporting ATPase subunit alpha
MDIDEKQPVQRVRFGDERTDEEANEHVGHGARNRRLSRQSSVGSLSIHSAGGARTVQPETALPITYRTLSIEIDEGQHEKQKQVKKAKEKAAVGMLLSSQFSLDDLSAC